MRVIVRLLWLFCLLPTLLGGCAPGGDLPGLPAGAGAYRLGPGDTIRLTTFGEDRLTGDFRVADDGTIAVPLLGNVPAAGQTPEALQTAIAGKLQQANLLREPKIAVEVSIYRPIFVLGEVNKPGQYPYQPGMTVVTAVAVAGGFTYRAVQDTASVLRNTHGTPVEYRAPRQALLRPGDVVTVFERRF